MPYMVTTRQICDRIYNLPKIQEAIDNGKEFARLGYDDFRAAITRDDLVVSETTRRDKWNNLIFQGILKISPGVRSRTWGLVDLNALSSTLGIPIYPDEKKGTKKNEKEKENKKENKDTETESQ